MGWGPGIRPDGWCVPPQGAAMARLSHPARAADLSVNGRLARSEAIMADMRLVLEEVKRRVVEVGENGPKPA